jgi:Zn-finger nucleic acid-binding protein
MNDALELGCPDCGGALRRLELRGQLVDECARCSAHFVEHAALAQLLERRVPSCEIVPKPKPLALPVEQQVRYRPCAVCRQLMNRKNFGGRSGVVVDVCSLHGLWFEHGELEAVIAFVERGGLAQARRDQDARERQAASFRAFSPSWPARDPLTAARDDFTSLSDLGQGVIELIEFLHDVLRPDFPKGVP